MLPTFATQQQERRDMKLVLTGATGFAGGEVLRQALADPEVERVTVLSRGPLGRSHAKLEEILLPSFLIIRRWISAISMPVSGRWVSRRPP
jgi:nucleoside-diphosphate-sugar epimerase